MEKYYYKLLIYNINKGNLLDIVKIGEIMKFRKIKIEEFEKLKKLFPNNEEMWIKYKNKRLQQLKKQYIGKTITAKIDRKMGSKHPKYGFIYPINYGYIPDTISGDGEELDCYILGIFEPIESFTGKCIAVIHRLNDNDDKLVLVPQGKHYTNAEIRELTEFQEKFFESIIIN